MIAPIVLYYLKTSENPTKFPATISFTIRKGIPRFVSNGFWLLGYGLFLRIIWKNGGLLSKIFAGIMFSTGFLANIIFPLGRGKDKLHFLFSLIYMLAHVVNAEIL